ncbi:hypothetical protein [Azospirillum sp. SYSU D00513]|uniref:hypothetical protein n=1 Tax=Azospirillum sp. SYSU D00513 TaxID=2812561 RepID=UPI001A95EFA3|nr:hypothetical protein [Azospirillum sp. SYSU D00513]
MATTDTTPQPSRPRNPRPSRSRIDTAQQPSRIRGSTPYLEKPLQIRSLQAQQIEQRGLQKTIDSMYIIDIIMRIVADPDEVDAVTKIITETLSAEGKELKAEIDRLRSVARDAGVSSTLSYNDERARVFAITTPHAMRLVKLVELFDEMMGLVDVLYLAGEIGGTAKVDAAHRWQKRIIRLFNKVITLEQRARLSAQNRGKGAEVNAAAGDKQTEAVEDIEGGPVSKADRRRGGKPASKEEARAPEPRPAPVPVPRPVPTALLEAAGATAAATAKPLTVALEPGDAPAAAVVEAAE